MMETRGWDMGAPKHQCILTAAMVAVVVRDDETVVDCDVKLLLNVLIYY
jgi:hypothetical protein